jgi:hypothetical protein
MVIRTAGKFEENRHNAGAFELIAGFPQAN